MRRLSKIWSSYHGFGLWHEEKCKENVVERMLKINIEPIIPENGTATSRPIGFQIFEILRKTKNLKIFFEKIHFYFVLLYFFWNVFFEGTLRVLRAETWLTVYRTIAIRKQWLSQPDQGPRKMVRVDHKMIEVARFCSTKCMKTQRKSCRAYIEDLDRANKIWE